MKMYIIVRRDLDRITQSYKYVQGMHVVAEYLLNHKTKWNNGTMIALGVSNKIALEMQKMKLIQHNIKFSEFYEPDIGNQLTAIACVCDGSLFKRLELL